MKFSTLSTNMWVFSCLILLLLGCSSAEDSVRSSENIEADTSVLLVTDSLSSEPIATVEIPKVSDNASIGVAAAELPVVRKLETPTAVSEVSIPKKSIPVTTSTVNTPVSNKVSAQSELTAQNEAISISFQAGSLARYKIGEQFARLPTPITAMGETSEISGVVYLNKEGYISGSDSSVIVVDVQSLKSDENKRDNWVRRNGGIGSEISIDVLEILGHPWPLPEIGDMEVLIKGDMTISEITKPVVWEGMLEIENKGITGSIFTVITWDQFELSKPRLPFIISVDDEIVLELNVVAAIE